MAVAAACRKNWTRPGSPQQQPAPQYSFRLLLALGCSGQGENGGTGETGGVAVVSSWPAAGPAKAPIAGCAVATIVPPDQSPPVL